MKITPKNPVPPTRHRVSINREGSITSNGSPISTTNYTPISVNGRVVGVVKGNEFIKKVKASKHFLRTPPAIAFDVDSLKQAERAGAREVRVKDTESGKVYRALISTILAKGFEIDRGHGRQLALPVSKWKLGDEPLVEQLHLWGVQQ